MSTYHFPLNRKFVALYCMMHPMFPLNVSFGLLRSVRTSVSRNKCSQLLQKRMNTKGLTIILLLNCQTNQISYLTFIKNILFRKKKTTCTFPIFAGGLFYNNKNDNNDDNNFICTLN